MTALDTDRFPAELLRLLVTARVELDLHQQQRRVPVCHTSFPCERASLADLALGAF